MARRFQHESILKAVLDANLLVGAITLEIKPKKTYFMSKIITESLVQNDDRLAGINKPFKPKI